MTPRRAQVLELVRSHVGEHGNSPSLGEIAAKLGVHKTTVLRHLQALEREGLVRRPKGVHRGVAVVDAAANKGVEPELFQALFNLTREVRAGIAFGDPGRVERALTEAKITADAWMNKTLVPCPPQPDEGCAEVAPPPAGQTAG